MLIQLFNHEVKLKAAAAENWVVPLVFFIMVLTLFPIALGAEKALLERTAVAAVWVAALLASLLGASVLFAEDVQGGHFEQVLVSGISPTLWVMIKCTVHWLLSGFLLSLVSWVCVPLFGVSFGYATWLFVSLILGTPVLMLFAALANALTLSLPSAGALAPVIALPLMLPVLIFAVSIPETAVAGFSVAPTLAFLAAMLVAALMCLPWVIAQSLRLTL